MSADSHRLSDSDDSGRISLTISAPIHLEDLRALLRDAGTLDAGVDLEAVLKRASFYVCAFDDKQFLIGFAKVVDDGGIHGFLLDPTVLRALRRKGIGTALISACVTEARRRGIEWLHVDFESHLAPFYRRCGFAPSSAGVMNLNSPRPNP